MTSETESSAEISYFWRVTSQSMMVLLIGFRFVSSNQKHYRPLGSDASSVWSFCARFSNVISRGNQWWRREISAVFSVYIMSSTTQGENQGETSGLSDHVFPSGQWEAWWTLTWLFEFSPFSWNCRFLYFAFEKITLREKFLQFDWPRAVVFLLSLKYLHVKITNL